LDVRQLRNFVGVVDTGSLSRAAVVLSVSQPSLSQQIAAMEAELGVALLVRSPSGVRPTEAGVTLYGHARAVLRQMQEMRAEIKGGGPAGAKGHVIVGLPTSMAAIMAVPLVERLAESQPGVRLQLLESFSGHMVELLANGRLDMAVLFRETEGTGISVTPLFTEYLSVYGAAHVGNPQSSTCRLSMLSGVPLVLPGRSNGLRMLIERAFAQARLELNVVADLDSLPAMLELARHGNVATVNTAALARLPGNTLLARRLVDPHICRPVSLCRQTTMPQTAASLVTGEIIRSLARELGPSWDKVA